MIFLDSSFLISLFTEKEIHHHKAIKIYRKIKNKELIISKLVIAETITLLRLKLNTNEIMEIYNGLNSNFNVINDTAYYDNAMREFLKYDGTISFFDSMYIYLMKKLEIHEIVSFDNDFDNKKNIVRIFK